MDHRLPDAIMTPQQVQLVRLEAERAIELTREAGRRKQGATLDVTPELRTLMGSENSLERLEAVKNLLLEAANFPVVHVIVPVLPMQNLRLELCKWFRDTIRPDLLLNFELNRGLAGGFGLRTPDAIFDYSFRKRLLEGTGTMKKVLKRLNITQKATNV